MSMEYCRYCDVMVDTDFNQEHFILNKANDTIVSCENKQQDTEVNK